MHEAATRWLGSGPTVGLVQREQIWKMVFFWLNKICLFEDKSRVQNLKTKYFFIICICSISKVYVFCGNLHLFTSQEKVVPVINACGDLSWWIWHNTFQFHKSTTHLVQGICTNKCIILFTINTFKLTWFLMNHKSENMCQIVCRIIDWSTPIR